MSCLAEGRESCCRQRKVFECGIFHGIDNGCVF